MTVVEPAIDIMEFHRDNRFPSDHYTGLNTILTTFVSIINFFLRTLRLEKYKGSSIIEKETER